MSRALAALAALCVALAPVAYAEDAIPAIDVVGTAQVAAAPDTARLSAGVVTEAATAGDAVRANTSAMQKVLDALDELGIEKKDVQTSGFSVSPVYGDRPGPRGAPAVTGYRVANQVQVAVRGVDKIGTVLDRLVAAGANDLGGIAFEVGEPTALQDEARRRALADARRKAELLATAAGVRLGRVLAIREAEAAAPGPLARMARMEAAAVPVAPGEVELAASLSVRYAIEP